MEVKTWLEKQNELSRIGFEAKHYAEGVPPRFHVQIEGKGYWDNLPIHIDADASDAHQAEVKAWNLAWDCYEESEKRTVRQNSIERKARDAKE